jgi:hypothetical protein
MTTLYFALQANPEQARTRVQKALGCELDREEGEAYDETIAFSGLVLGIHFTLFHEDMAWAEGHVYKLVGTPIKHENTKNRTSLDFHVAQLLRAQGITHVLDQDEFNSECLRRKQGSSNSSPT